MLELTNTSIKNGSPIVTETPISWVPTPIRLDLYDESTKLDVEKKKSIRKIANWGILTKVKDSSLRNIAANSNGFPELSRLFDGGLCRIKKNGKGGSVQIFVRYVFKDEADDNDIIQLAN